MIYKIILGLVLTLCLYLLGVKISEKQRLRKEIFEELIMFNTKFLCEMSLFKTKVLEALDSSSDNLRIVFAGAGESLLQGRDFVCTDKRLSLNQRRLVSQYVNSLGSFDSGDDSLKLFGERLKFELSCQEKTYEKGAKVYGKLGLSFGLILSILLF